MKVLSLFYLYLKQEDKFFLVDLEFDQILRSILSVKSKNNCAIEENFYLLYNYCINEILVVNQIKNIKTKYKTVN